MSTNTIQKIAIVGVSQTTHPNPLNLLTTPQASGHLGGQFTKELLKSGTHTITAITRDTSSATFPAGIQTARVNYDDESSIVAALTGQQFLIITLGTRVAQDLHSKIVSAAIKAGVPYIMPNVYGYDMTNKALVTEPSDLYSAGCVQKIDEIRSLGGGTLLSCPAASGMSGVLRWV